MVKVKLTEKAYRKEFIEKLNLKLSKHNLEIYDDVSLSYFDKKNNKKRTHFPDLIIGKKECITRTKGELSFEPGGLVAVIETKHPKKSVYEGVPQALKYMSDLNTNKAISTNFKDVVAIKVVEKSTDVAEKINPQFTKEALDSVIIFITQVVLETKKLEPVSVSDELVVKILNGAVTEIVHYTNKIKSEELEGPLGFFFAKKLDSNLLKSSKEKREFKYAIQKAAAYLIINQIVFYHVLSVESNKYPSLENIKSSNDLQNKYFDKVLSDDYRSVFGAKVTTFLPKASIEPLNTVINAIVCLKIEQIKHDILGKIFHGLLPQELRKRTAAYYTSNAGAELLARLSIENKDEKVLDPACGSGTLLVAAYHKKKELYKRVGKDIHHKLVNQIYGGDISLFASHLAAIHLALEEPLSYTDDLHILLGDAFELTPKKSNLLDYMGAARFARKVNAEKIKKVEFKLPYVDVVIMNPPFTRMERLETDYKEFILNTFRQNEQDKYYSGRMGLHSLFVIHSDNFLKEGGKIAAVLPAATFYTESGKLLKEFLINKYHIQYIISSEVESTFSEQCAFKEILFIAKKTNKKKNNITKFVTLKVPLSLRNVKELSKKINEAHIDFEDNKIRIRNVTRDNLAKEQNWMVFSEKKDSTYKILTSNSENLCIGEEVLKNKISEGIRRFPINFFYFPNRDWKIIYDSERILKTEHTQTKEKLSFSKKLLIKAIRKPELYNTMEIKADHYILSIPPFEKLDRDLKRYISLAEKQNYHKESVTLVKETNKQNIPWYSYTNLLFKNPKIFGRCFAIDKINVNTQEIIAHFVEEKATAGSMFHILSLGDSTDAQILTMWFNSSIFLFIFLNKGREIGGVWYRTLISDLKKLPILNIKKLTKEQKQKLISIFREYKDLNFDSLPKQFGEKYRDEIDSCIIECLNFKGNKDKLLKDIRCYIIEKIRRLKVQH